MNSAGRVDGKSPAESTRNSAGESAIPSDKPMNASLPIRHNAEASALAKEKKFWLNSVCASFAALVLTVVGGLFGIFALVNLHFQMLSNLDGPNGGQAMMQQQTMVKYFWMGGILLATLVFIWLVISIIRYLAVPKPAL